MNHINEIGPQKQKEESQFRVHFYLRGVYYSSEKRLQHFLEETAAHISQIAPVSIIQVHGIIKKYVDVSVGLKSDAMGVNLMESKRKIVLYGQNRNLVEYEPVFSESFKMFYNFGSGKAGQQSFKSIEPVKNQAKGQKQSSTYRETLEQSKRTQREDQMVKRSDAMPIYHELLYIFGVPLQYKDKEVIQVLHEQKIGVKYYTWKMSEDMEYLLVELIEALSDHEISSLDLYIDRYPLLVAFKRHEQTISNLILKHEVELDFEKDINEVELMKTAAKVGGVVAMVKDEYYGPRKYVTAFNSLSKIACFLAEMDKVFKGFRVGKPKYALRVSRVQRGFTFTNMMYNLGSYENELKRVQSSCFGRDQGY